MVLTHYIISMRSPTLPFPFILGLQTSKGLIHHDNVKLPKKTINTIRIGKTPYLQRPGGHQSSLDVHARTGKLVAHNPSTYL